MRDSSRSPVMIAGRAITHGRPEPRTASSALPRAFMYAPRAFASAPMPRQVDEPRLDLGGARGIDRDLREPVVDRLVDVAVDAVGLRLARASCRSRCRSAPARARCQRRGERRGVPRRGVDLGAELGERRAPLVELARVGPDVRDRRCRRARIAGGRPRGRRSRSRRGRTRSPARSALASAACMRALSGSTTAGSLMLITGSVSYCS